MHAARRFVWSMEKDAGAAFVKAGAAFVRAGAGMPDGHAKGRGLNIEAAESCYKQQCIVPACRCRYPGLLSSFPLLREKVA